VLNHAEHSLLLKLKTDITITVNCYNMDCIRSVESEYQIIENYIKLSLIDRTNLPKKFTTSTNQIKKFAYREIWYILNFNETKF